MTNLSQDFKRPYKLPSGGLRERILPLAGYTNFEGGNVAYEVYKGALVLNDVSDTDGYFRPGDSGITVTNTDIFGGIALERVSVTSADTADGSKSVTVAVNGEWGFVKGDVAQTDVGAVIYSTDDTSVTTTTTAGLAIGILTGVDSVYAWVDISNYAGKISSTTA
jgi:hypothetical protein